MTPRQRIIYTAGAHVAGGRAEGHGRTADGALEVDLPTPTEMGGQGGGTKPEELFAVGYAACLESALGAAGRRQRQEEGDVAIDSKVMLLAGEGRRWELAAELAITLPAVKDPAVAEALVREAHRTCPYSNATRGNIGVALTVNGRGVETSSEAVAI
jgi:osmotically inducible protein OsmC